MTQALIVDDNIKNVNVLARLLAEQGVTSLQATDPTLIDALIEQAETLDVIFVDLEMPGLDGFEVLDRLKATPNTQNVPVIAYTVHVSEIHEAHQHGFDGFIGKPIDPDKFPGQLDRILNNEPVWETA